MGDLYFTNTCRYMFTVLVTFNLNNNYKQDRCEVTVFIKRAINISASVTNIKHNIGLILILCSKVNPAELLKPRNTSYATQQQ